MEKQKIVDVLPPVTIRRRIKKKKKKKSRRRSTHMNLLQSDGESPRKQENKDLSNGEMNKMDSNLMGLMQLNDHIDTNYSENETEKISHEKVDVENFLPQKRARSQPIVNEDDSDDEFELKEPVKKKQKKVNQKVVSLKSTNTITNASKKASRQEKFKEPSSNEEELLFGDVEDDGEMLFDEDDEYLEEDEFSELIKSSKAIEQSRQQDEEDALNEMEEAKLQMDTSDLKIFEEIEEKQRNNEIDTSADIQSRIVRIVKILLNFKMLGEKNRSRNEYVNLLQRDLCEYYGYVPDLMGKFFDFFAIPQVIEFLEASEKPRPVTIRCNTLKVSRKQLTQLLSSRGIDLDSLDGKWSKSAIKIYDTKVPIGATPEYMAGYYMLQNPGSILPVIALDARQNDIVLDMSAAPGVKTVHLGEAMKNTGVIYANDINKGRMKGLVANVHRMGVRNVIVINYDGRDLSRVLPKCDRVLLDAPCSGVGVISKDPSVKSKRTTMNVLKSTTIQKELILSAVDCLKVGGTLVYSTCSILPEENESVVDYCISKRYVKIIPTNIHFGEKGFTKVKGKRFHDGLKNAKRFYPHVHNIDGFFVCKMVKVQDGTRMSENARKNKVKKAKKMKKMKEEKKKENLKNQKEREDYNKALFKECMKAAKGNVELAKELMKERKKKIMNNRKRFKKKKGSKKWRKTY